MDARVLPSAAAPLLTQHALHGVVREVRATMNTLARTGDAAGASGKLNALASSIPSGSEGLAPMWRNDLGLYRPNRPGSVAVAETRILGDLRRFVRGGRQGGGGAPVASPAPTPPEPPQGTSPTTTNTPAPSPSPSVDNVTIRNTTGLALVVTVHLQVPQVQKPWITETIPAQGTTALPFDFRTATRAFMTMDIARADGGQSPSPFDHLSLDQPIGGYDGEVFTISVFGSNFNVTPG